MKLIRKRKMKQKVKKKSSRVKMWKGKCTVDLVGDFEKPIGRFPIKETSKQRHIMALFSLIGSKTLILFPIPNVSDINTIKIYQPKQIIFKIQT